ncbi:MAG: hypothetical protein U0228_18975 [Myxococcaceae bacterium]
MQRILVVGVVLVASLSFAQSTPDIPQEKVVVIPMGGEVDAGVAQPPPQPPPEPLPPTPDTPAYVPPNNPDTRTLEALPPVPPPPENLDTNPAQIQPQGPGAMIDGHPREGAFLSGPGSFTFLMHHTLMTGLGGLATQMIPRAVDASPLHPSIDGKAMDGCATDANGVPTDPRYKESGANGKPVATCAEIFTGDGARIAYLTGTLLGAGLGFTAAAIWQFNNWISHRSAGFGIISSFFGGMLLGGFTDLVTSQRDPYATAWLTLIGSSAGAWVAAIVGGGDIPLNKELLIVSGGGWAAVYTALIVAIVATTGGNITARSGLDGVMLTPALGAAAMALATLKFNPSVGQILRADLFGGVVGGAVLLISALLLGPTVGFTRPVPYILAGIGAIGAKTLVSFLWADAAENPGTTADGSPSGKRYRNVWW